MIVYPGITLGELMSKGIINFETDEFGYSLLHNLTYTNQKKYSDIAGYEVQQGYGYTAGMLLPHEITYPTTGTGYININFGDIWVSLTHPIVGVSFLAIYDKTITSPYKSPIILIADFEQTFDILDTQHLHISNINLRINGG